MRKVEHYLSIPEAYGRWLGGLRWSDDREAIEYAADDPEIGLTFAMSAEVALFLEGIASAGTFPAFPFVLHFLLLLGFGNRHAAAHGSARVESHRELARAFQETGRPLRNAASLCAALCREIPRVPDPPDPAVLQLRLYERTPSEFAIPTRWTPEEPPLSPEAFEAHVRRSLGRLTAEELRHWLRHGRGPIRDASEALTRVMPKTLTEVLATLEDRPRLRGATGLVSRLDGALTLPPRRLAHSDLPLGGYADVVTRGLPERILPAQFALDPDEFLRRFAANELLFFHREEPHAPTARELVLVVDQGVRTWGDVRLALAAGAISLSRQADRRGLGLRLATTGNGGELVDPLGIEIETFAELLESSDLSRNPAAALARVLNSEAGAPCDLVLLTHPRSLAEPDVVAAARAAGDETRLFAVAVDPAGEVTLSELKGGTPVAIGRCRIDLAEARAREAEAPPPSLKPNAPAPRWRGDVEPIGFPFSLGALAPIVDSHFAFDDAGEWLLLGGLHGLLHAWRTDGSDAVMLPRATLGGNLLDSVQAVFGVAGGFVVVGVAGHRLVAAHYDWQSRKCLAHDLDMPPHPARRWSYVRHLHCVVARDGKEPRVAIDLAEIGLRAQCPRGVLCSSRASQAFALASQGPLEPVILPDGGTPPRTGRVISFRSQSGEIAIRADSGEWDRHIPLSEGRPKLTGGHLIQARWNENTLAVLIAHPDGRRVLHIYTVWGQWLSLGDHVLPRDARDFALSRDGLRIAWRCGDRQLVSRGVGTVGPPALLTQRGRSHTSGINLELGDSFFTAQAGRHAHLVRWDRGVLEFVRIEGKVDTLVERTFVKLPLRITARGGGTRHAALSGEKRFIAFAVMPNLTAAVDRLGQVAVLDRSGQLICMFFVFRDQIAAWAPDGTKLGPVALIGGPPTLGGEERIGATLAAVSQPGRLAR